MTAIGLALAVMLEVLAIGAVILLAARTYERAILRIGAPVKLKRLSPRARGRRAARPRARKEPQP